MFIQVEEVHFTTSIEYPEPANQEQIQLGFEHGGIRRRKKGPEAWGNC